MLCLRMAKDNLEKATDEKSNDNLKKATVEELKAVWKHICKMHDEGISGVQICRITGANKSTVSDVLKRYKETKKIPVPKSRGRKIGEGRLLTPEQEKEIKKTIIDKNPNQLKFDCCLWDLNAVKQLILRKYNINLSIQAVWEYLDSWGMSSQRPLKRAYKQNIEKVEEFKTTLFPAIKKRAAAENAEIFFADEAGINNQAYNPRGFAPKGQPPIAMIESKRESINMLAAIAANGHRRFMLYRETTTQQKLIEFMKCMVREQKRRKKKKVFLILDNLKVHHGKLVAEYLEKSKDDIEVFYFPSYSPEINPEEYLNNAMKQNIHSGIPPRTATAIHEKATTFMHNFSKQKIRNLFLHPKIAYVAI